jgi:hypothetical protein
MSCCFNQPQSTQLEDERCLPFIYYLLSSSSQLLKLTAVVRCLPPTLKMNINLFFLEGPKDFNKSVGQWWHNTTTYPSSM